METKIKFVERGRAHEEREGEIQSKSQLYRHRVQIGRLIQVANKKYSLVSQGPIEFSLLERGRIKDVSSE